MKFFTASVISVLALLRLRVEGFSTGKVHRRYGATASMSTIVPKEASSTTDVADIEIPTNLPSDVGEDYIPLATMLATGQLAEADQVRSRLSSRNADSEAYTPRCTVHS